MNRSLLLGAFAVVAGGWLLLVSREPPKAGRAAPAVSRMEAERPPAPFRDALLEEAKTLRPELAEQIRRELQAGVRDPQRRAVLMAWLWHQGAPSSVWQRAEHVLWFIANEPASEFLDWPPAWFAPGELGPTSVEKILTAWRRAVREHPFDPRPGWLAAKWFQRRDERRFVEFVKASLEAQPDFGPAADALAEWCVRQIALQGADAREARRLLDATLNPEIQKRAARRFHQLAEGAENDPKQRNSWRREARKCFARAREIEPYLREADVFAAAGQGAADSTGAAGYSFSEVQPILNAGWRQLKKLPVDAFPDLPPAVAETLKRMGCTIPQAYWQPAPGGPNNVLRGRFYGADHDSWAVLCGVQETVRLLVFRDETDRNPETLLGGLITSCMQTTGPDSAGFSWAITVADEAVIRRYHREFGSSPLPPLDHDGIESHALGKASVIFYWHNGRWLRLPGAD